MNKFEEGLTRYFKKDELKRIRSTVIGIAGAGGLGSNCAVNLVRCGFRNLVIADHDSVDSSNLNRQFFFEKQIGQLKVDALKENLKAINHDLRITAVNEKLRTEKLNTIFGECDVIIEALDAPHAKKMVVEHFIPSKKLLVAASGIGGTGATDQIRIHRRSARFYVVGDLVSGVSETCPPLSPGIAVVAAKQADIVLSHVLNG